MRVKPFEVSILPKYSLQMIKEQENEDWLPFHSHNEIDSQHFHSLLSTPDHFMTPDFQAFTFRVFKENAEYDMIDERDQIIFGPGISQNQLNMSVSMDHNTHCFQLSSISQMVTSSVPLKKKRTKKSKKENAEEKNVVKEIKRKVTLKMEDLWSFKIRNPNFFKDS